MRNILCAWNSIEIYHIHTDQTDKHMFMYMVFVPSYLQIWRFFHFCFFFHWITQDHESVIRKMYYDFTTLHTQHSESWISSFTAKLNFYPWLILYGFIYSFVVIGQCILYGSGNTTKAPSEMLPIRWRAAGLWIKFLCSHSINCQRKQFGN